MLSNRLATTALTAIAPALWGTTYLVTTELLPPQRPLLAALLRALPAGLLLLGLTRRLPTGSWWWRSLVLGSLNIGAFFALLFVAAYRLPGGVAATILASQPLIVAALAAGLLGERMRARIVIAAVAGVAGVSLLVLQADAQLDAVGVAAAAAGAMVMATGVVLSKRWPSPAPLLATTSWQLVGGGVFLLPIALLAEGPPPTTLSLGNFVGYAYLSVIGAALAYALWFRGIRDLSPTKVTFLGLLSPVVATALGWLALDQALTLAQGLGGLIVLAALLAAQTSANVARAQATPPTPRTPLRIAVFGAGGDIGRRVVTEALARGHEVTAVVRNRARLHELDPRATAIVGDASSVDDVNAASKGQDLVISATRPSVGRERELVAAAHTLLAGVKESRVRLLIVGGAASLRVPGAGEETVIDDPNFPSSLRAIAEACNDQLDVCRADTEVDWAYLSPAASVEPGERTGAYRLGADDLLVDSAGDSKISMEDLAVALVDEAEQPVHHRKRFTVAY